MKPKTKRLLILICFLAMFFVGCFIIISNLRKNLIYFYSPSEVLENDIYLDKIIRVGGMVKKESLKKKVIIKNGNKLEEISFIITDYDNEVNILYVGILPDLFKEGQGVVVEGVMSDKQTFKARNVLAKHDENYMPPEIKNIQSIKDKENDI